MINHLTTETEAICDMTDSFSVDTSQEYMPSSSSLQLAMWYWGEACSNRESPFKYHT